MGKVFLKFSNSSNPDYLVITWSLFASPLAEISRASYAPPHPERSLTVENLAPVMHRFSFWQSIDGTALTTKLLDMDIDASLNSEFEIFDYVVDRGSSGVDPDWNDPVSGNTTVTDERLISTKFFISRRGIGYLRPDEYTKNALLGTWTLTGTTFETEDTFFATVMGAQTSGFTGSSGGSDYEDIVSIDTNQSIISAHYKKLVEFFHTAGIITYTITTFSGITKTKILFNTHRITGRYVCIDFSGQNVPFLGLLKSKIWLGKGEELELLFTGTDCRVMRYDGDYRRLGLTFPGRGIENNTVQQIGQLVNIADYPRVYYDFVAQLPSNQIKTMAAWGTQDTTPGSPTEGEYPNKGFFAVDIGAGTMRFPDLRNRSLRFLKLDGTDATRFTDHAGGFQMDDNKAHSHRVATTGNQASVNPGKALQRSATNPDPYESGVGLVGPYIETMGTEARPKNIGFTPQIII